MFCDSQIMTINSLFQFLDSIILIVKKYANIYQVDLPGRIDSIFFKNENWFQLLNEDVVLNRSNHEIIFKVLKCLNTI